jgi:peptidoglycan/xylan/chitin deacetylase (PgdA/CDA1 family)
MNPAFQTTRQKRDRRARTGSCVLTFHRIVSRRDRDHDVSWITFRNFLDQVEQRGLSVRADLNRPDRDGRTLVLTFDDGTDDHLRFGEELHDRGIAGIFFVTAGRLGRAKYLSSAHLGELVSQGHVIGSHALDHVPLRELDRDQLRHQLVQSKALLEDETGTPISYFAPPGGIPNVALASEVARSGYSACRSMSWGFYQSADERLWVPCLPFTELTARFWIDRALRGWHVPRTMHTAWLMKNLLPNQVVGEVRRWLHRSGPIDSQVRSEQ